MDSKNQNIKCSHLNDSNITYNLSGKQIYREQCSKCYDDPVLLINISKVRMDWMYV